MMENGEGGQVCYSYHLLIKTHDVSYSHPNFIFDAYHKMLYMEISSWISGILYEVLYIFDNEVGIHVIHVINFKVSHMMFLEDIVSHCN